MWKCLPVRLWYKRIAVGTVVFVGFNILRVSWPIFLRFQVSNTSVGSEGRGKQERGVWKGHEKTPKIWRPGTVRLVLHMENRISGPNSIFKVKTITGLFGMPKWLSLSHWVSALIMSLSSPIIQVSLSSSMVSFITSGTSASMPWEELPTTSR